MLAISVTVYDAFANQIQFQKFAFRNEGHVQGKKKRFAPFD